MMKRTKWALAALLTLAALVLITAASLALSEPIFFPVVYKQPTFTPTPTPTATATPTPTATPQAAVMITHIEADPSGPDIEGEFVTVKNQTGQSVNMTDWTLKDRTSVTFAFPDNFSLGSGKSVDVWSKEGTNTSSDLYWGLSSPIWDNVKDCGYLYDEDDDLVDEFCYDREP
jgi:hypothetical protein